ncbi:hypothetical protein [Roseateles depolymerans]|uniref:Uncharacterized protein n=1 Tax=Roseateles depolymerans TaxID=76731 RepID=A0A0U3MGY9_9BURK|nr:hypothetical protein [Roseateles depolymerans]ALV07673.1 hypothetical protein RD2015_3214 [Roseateles depolymerans]REG22104.1 hypothetical protein DES44_1247 [Roseateles depolymerans]
MSISIDTLLPRMAGFNLIDCEIKDRETFYLLGREDYTQRTGRRELEDAPPEGRLPKRIFVLRLNNAEGKRWGHMHLTGLNQSFCAMTYAPEEKILVVDSDTKVWSQNPNSNGFEPPSTTKGEGGILAGPVTRVKSFGAELWACSACRQVLKRNGPSQWELLGPPINVSDSDFRGCGFDDFDRFSPNDVYAVGGSGEVWHFDGAVWRRCKFPSSWGISAVLCAPDGNVYIAAGTVIYRGFEDRWERLDTKDLITLPIKDLVWYEGQLWATNDYGIWTLSDHSLMPADVPSAVKVCSGNLAVRDGVMLLAGYGGAAYKRDGTWVVIFHDHEVREWFGANRDKVWKSP